MALTKASICSGVKHLSIKWERILKRRRQEFFLPRYHDLAFPVRRYADFHGDPSVCHICGYAMIRLELEGGWTLDICSAFPSVQLDNAQLAQWQSSLQRRKLPTSCV